MADFKNRLESFKKKNKLNGNDLAKAGEISPQSVSAYGNMSLPRAEVLMRWATKLNLNITWLLTGKGEMLDNGSTLPIESTIINQTVPVTGIASCGTEGFEQIMPFVMAASPLKISPNALVVMAMGDSMIPAGIGRGNICYCDPDLTPVKHEAVLVRQRGNKGATKLFLGSGSAAGMTAFMGWLPPKDADKQEPFTLEILNTEIETIAPVVFIRRRL